MRRRPEASVPRAWALPAALHYLLYSRTQCAPPPETDARSRALIDLLVIRMRYGRLSFLPLFSMLSVVLLVSVPETGAQSLKGSRQTRILQNRRADRLGYSVVQNKKQLRRLVARGRLVPIRKTKNLRVSRGLPAYRRVLRPQAEDYSQYLARTCRLDGPPLRITSATRTPDVQSAIRTNAAPSGGPAASLHLRGLAFDVAREGLTRRQQKCIERIAIRHERQSGRGGRFDAIKEHRHGSRCYHFSVVESPIRKSTTIRRGRRAVRA